MTENEIRTIADNLNKKTEQEFFDYAEKFFNGRISFLKKCSELFSGYNEKWINSLEQKDKRFIKRAEFYDAVEELLHSEASDINKNLFFDLAGRISNELISDFERQPALIKLEQLEEHFGFSSGENASLKLQMQIKRTAFKTFSKIVRLFKGKNAPYAWKRNVPVRNLLRYYLHHSPLAGLYSKIAEIISQCGGLYFDIYNQFGQYELNISESLLKDSNEEIKTKLEAGSEAIKKFLKAETDKLNRLNDEIKNFLKIQSDNLRNELTESFGKVGTVALRPGFFNDAKTIKRQRQLNSTAQKLENNTKTFFAAAHDRLEFYFDLMWYSHLAAGNAFAVVREAAAYKTNYIDHLFEKASHEIEKTKDLTDNAGAQNSDALETEKNKLLDIIDKRLNTQIVDSINAYSLEQALDGLMHKLHGDLNEFEKEYLFVRPKNLVLEIKERKLKKFSPKEIIEPIIINKLHKEFYQIVDSYKEKNKKINSGIIELGRIIEFSFNSAITYERSEDDQTKNAEKILSEGLDRTKNRYKDLLGLYSDNVSGLESSIEALIKKTLNELMDLSSIERLMLVKIRVSREKLTERLKTFLISLLQKIRIFFRLLKSKTKHGISYTKDKLYGISARVGLTDDDDEVSAEIKNYLTGIAASIEKLPYIYQKLFANKQISDERFFVAREREHEKFNRAFEGWLNKKPASVILVGEKGSGTSSLINIAVSKLNNKFSIYRKEYSNTIYKEGDLLIVLEKLLKIPDAAGTENLIGRILSEEEKRIVIIENLEDFFLRSVDGFNALYIIFDIVARTRKNIFWIFTCNIYSWNYLDRAISIKDYFTDVIKLGDLSEEELKTIILKRHGISGYNLKFLPGEEIKIAKSFNKLNDEEKQEYLSRNFYKNLKKRSSNNIGAALYLWMKSINSFSNDEILVSADSELDFAFLKRLPDKKLFTLMNLILHDGLSVSEHSKILNCGEELSRLELSSLESAGIVFRKDDKFKINFQLYKNIVTLLQDKNILH